MNLYARQDNAQLVRSLRLAATATAGREYELLTAAAQRIELLVDRCEKAKAREVT